jgi:hypothetical protein
MYHGILISFLCFSGYAINFMHKLEEFIVDVDPKNGRLYCTRETISVWLRCFLDRFGPTLWQSELQDGEAKNCTIPPVLARYSSSSAIIEAVVLLNLGIWAVYSIRAHAFVEVGRGTACPPNYAIVAIAYEIVRASLIILSGRSRALMRSF